VGVWIETGRSPEAGIPDESHPAWVCGLKQSKGLNKTQIGSHTLRGCVD